MANLISSSKFMGIWSLMTGIFATISSLYTWGEGLIFTVNHEHLAIIITDLLVTAPLAYITAYGILKQSTWVKKSVLLFSGILIYGSIAVYSTEFILGAPYTWYYFLPPVFGMLQAVMLIRWCSCFKDQHQLVIPAPGIS
ncbi:MAG: hypothetical protein INQ03_13610 [Candidatus Heimdallarchaeota archaeon]|nr:hypothetical protein [Candidatus Heimdallarchaeota archaeon]